MALNHYYIYFKLRDNINITTDVIILGIFLAMALSMTFVSRDSVLFTSKVFLVFLESKP